MAFALPIRADRRRKNAPKAVSVRPTVTAASRNSDAARLLLRRVAEDRIFPPEILLRGANESQEVKCLALGHAERSVPHSPTSLSARYGPSPWICVNSIPCTAYRASRAAKLGRGWERSQVQTVRWRLFQTAGKIVRHGRQIFLQIGAAMLDMFAAIREPCARIMREGGAIPETS